MQDKIEDTGGNQKLLFEVQTIKSPPPPQKKNNKRTKQNKQWLTIYYTENQKIEQNTNPTDMCFNMYLIDGGKVVIDSHWQ